MSTMKLVIFTLLVGAIMADDPDPAAAAPPPAPDADLKWAPFSGRYFVYVEKEMVWTDAQQFCMAHGGSLASIDDKFQDQFVKALSYEQPAWIGFSDAQIDECWLWINSDTTQYTGWCGGQRNHTCAVTNFSDEKCWESLDCNTEHRFVCSKEETQSS